MQQVVVASFIRHHCWNEPTQKHCKIYMNEEDYVDAQNMYQQHGCIKCAKQGVMRHYEIAYDIFNKDCFMHGWLSTRILQSLFHMLTINKFWM